MTIFSFHTRSLCCRSVSFVAITLNDAKIHIESLVVSAADYDIICDDVKIEILYRIDRQSVMDLSIQFLCILLGVSVCFSSCGIGWWVRAWHNAVNWLNNSCTYIYVLNTHIEWVKASFIGAIYTLSIFHCSIEKHRHIEITEAERKACQNIQHYYFNKFFLSVSMSFLDRFNRFAY